MEPHREEQPKAPELSAEQKPKRFRIVKLEERIAPGKVEPMGGSYTCWSPCTSYTCGQCLHHPTERECYPTQWHCK
jgi:hypothetical protein